jgi:ligand-binding sensor domain-containing protein
MNVHNFGHVLIVATLLSGQAGAQFVPCRTWVTLNRGDVAGLVFDKNGRVVVGAGCGVLISSDRGTSWPITGIHVPLKCIAIDSTGTLLGGAAGGRLFRSTDLGAQWSETSIPGRAIRTLFVMKDGDIFAGTEGTGMQRSTDHGQTWHQRGFAGATVRHACGGSDSTAYAILQNGGLYRSTDDGNTWLSTTLSRGSIRTVAAGGNGVALAGGMNEGVYRSTDHGGTWTADGLPGDTVYAMAIDAQGSALVATPTGLFQCASDDTAWNLFATPCKEAIVSLAIASDGTLFAATIGDIYRSEGGGQWTRLGVDVRDNTLSALVRIDGRFIAASSDGGIYVSDNGGFHWACQDSMIIPRDARTLAVNDSVHIFAGLGDGYVMTSTDRGVHWNQLPRVWSNALVLGLACDSGGLVYAGVLGDGVFRSSDEGKSWTAASMGLLDRYVRTLLRTSRGSLLVGTDGGVFKSTDGASTWDAAGPLTLSHPVLCLTEDIDSSLYAGTAGFGVFRSIDGGDSWQPADEGLGSFYVQTLTCGDGWHIYAGTLAGGVFETLAGAWQWTALNSGLPALDINFLSMNPPFIYSGTRGSWGSRLDPRGITSAPLRPRPVASQYALEQNYPNPFNPVTTIRYCVPMKSHVSLAVFDILGREVERLVDGIIQPGAHEARFDATLCASGAYVYRLTIGAESQARTMIVLK